MKARLPMKLHCHPASTTSRPLLMFVAERDIAIDIKTVDLFTGEHLGEGFSALNPSRLVPVLDEGLLGERNAYLCGADPSIADHYGAAFVHLAELIDLDLRAYPRVHGWLARMKRSPYWSPTYAPIEGFVATLPRAAAVAA